MHARDVSLSKARTIMSRLAWGSVVFIGSWPSAVLSIQSALLNIHELDECEPLTARSLYIDNVYTINANHEIT